MLKKFKKIWEKSREKFNKVEQSWTKLNKVKQTLKHCYRVISENLVKFDKQIAENIKILLSVSECVSEIWSYWAAYAAKKRKSIQACVAEISPDF